MRFQESPLFSTERLKKTKARPNGRAFVSSTSFPAKTTSRAIILSAEDKQKVCKWISLPERQFHLLLTCVVFILRTRFETVDSSKDCQPHNKGSHKQTNHIQIGGHLWNSLLRRIGLCIILVCIFFCLFINVFTNFQMTLFRVWQWQQHSSWYRYVV